MSQYLELAEKILINFEEVLPPQKLFEKLADLKNSHPELMTNILGKSLKGDPITMITLGSGTKQALWYGFPDPGEAVGGTVIYHLIETLLKNPDLLKGLDYIWNFIPCLNRDDQPFEGEKLGKVMKGRDQEVDWMLQNPRPETTVLTNIASLLSPLFIFPMHDEFHTEEMDLPMYFPVSHVLTPNQCEMIRGICTDAGLKISPDFQHPEMGEGFLYMPQVQDYTNSTFSVFARSGLVFICEVPDSKEVEYKVLAKVQLACGLALMGQL